MRLKITCLFIFISSALLAQNYHPFPNSNDTLSFRETYGLVRFMRFDSVVAQAQSTSYFLQNEVRFGYPSNDNCDGHLKDTAWAGHKVEVSPTGIHFYHPQYDLFFDPNRKTTQAINAGQLSYNNNLYNFQLSYLHTSFHSIFNGVMDSVRSFKLTTIDTSGQPFGNMSDSVIRISKNHGLLSLPYFLGHNGYEYYTRTNYDLLTTGEIFDFAVGDEFQYRHTSYSLNSPGNPNVPPATHTLLEIIGKTYPSPDSVVYTIKRTFNSFSPAFTNPPSFVETVYRDTITRRYGNLNEVFTSKLTNESDTLPITTEWYEDTATATSYVKLKKEFFGANGDCIFLYIEPPSEITVLKPGLGMTHSEMYSFSGPAVFLETDLVYYKKGNSTSGTKVNISLSEMEKPSLSFYPNPASNHLHFELTDSKPLEIKIWNSAGQQVRSVIISRENNSITVDQLPTGIYILKSEKGSAKFVKL